MKKRKKEIKIEKSMTFAEILKNKPEAGRILMKKGFHCIGCPMALRETLEQGALMHGIDVDKLVKELNKKKKTKQENE